jgi:DNA-binding transcriptional regulator YiaG
VGLLQETSLTGAARGCIALAYRLHHPQSKEVTMARKKKLDFSDIATTRKKANLNQKDFWKGYGVTQSGGSRYESGRNIPKPLAILLWLHQSGKVTDKDLADALK